MKHLSTFFLCLVLTASLQAAVPTPDSAMTFRIDRDPRKWAIQHQAGNKTGVILEFVPEGDSIKAWKEMVEHQIAFTKVPLRKYVDTWKELVLKADPKAEPKEETLADGSILVTYTALSADETSLRKFIKGKDGIYMLAYHVRPKLKQDETFKLWEEIVRAASLLPNPEKKKK